MSRCGSKRSIAFIRPSSPYETRSPSSTCAGRPGAEPPGDVLDERRVRQDQAVAQALVARALVLVPDRNGVVGSSCSRVRVRRARPADGARSRGCIPGSCRPMRGRAVLDAAQVGPALQEMGGERVPQGVRRALRRAPPRRARARSAGAHREGCSGRPRTLRKRRSARPRSRPARPAAGQVALERGLGCAAERDDPLLAALAGDAQRSRLDRRPRRRSRSPHASAGAQAAAVQELEQRAVAQPPRLGGRRPVEQPLHLGLRERRRQLPHPARAGDERGRVSRHERPGRA